MLPVSHAPSGGQLPDPFEAFADKPRWLAWREEKRGGRPTKVPYNVHGRGHGSATDPATWGTHAEAEARARGLQNGSKSGCGIVLGDLGDETYLVGVDLDSSINENGALADWAVPIVSALASYAEVSPSGCGLKVFFYIAAADARWLLDCLGVDRDKWGCKRSIPSLSGADHGPGIELYCSHRYFTVTHAQWTVDHPHITLLERGQLETLAALIPTTKSGSGPAADSRDNSRSAKAWRAALAMQAASYEEMCEGLRHHEDPEIRCWVREKGEPHNERELLRLWERGVIGSDDGEAGDTDEGVRLDDFHAYMEPHKYFFAPTRALWPSASVNGCIPPIQIGVDNNGKPVFVSAAAWLDRNRRVEQMTWAPGMPMIIKDRLISEGGWIERKNVSIFNLYRPPLLAHGDPAKADPWIEHVARVYPDDAEHIIKWLAQRVQHPEQKINHALVLGGEQGIGKDSLIEPVKRAVGPWNVHEIGPKHLTEQFNDFARSVILRVSEARDLGEVDRYAFYEQMKVYCASPPDVLRVNGKYLPQYSLLNCCGVIITTNHKTDGLYLPAEDRRHYVSWSALKKEEFGANYWKELWDWYDNGGDGHVAAFLDRLDLHDFDPKAPPPKTPAFWDIVNAGRAPENAELADVIEVMGGPDVVSLSALIKAAFDHQRHDVHEWLGERKNRRVIPHRLEACNYMPVRNPDAEDGLWKIDGRRQAVYGKTRLTVAEQISAVRQELKKPGWEQRTV